MVGPVTNITIIARVHKYHDYSSCSQISRLLLVFPNITIIARVHKYHDYFLRVHKYHVYTLDSEQQDFSKSVVYLGDIVEVGCANFFRICELEILFQFFCTG